ncbi:MAG: hypothetical protein KDB21_06565, partial [Acidimicrobiales bacterium]|nr:hypothetical protein [Acidimicrobiales bacterium]
MAASQVGRSRRRDTRGRVGHHTKRAVGRIAVVTLCELASSPLGQVDELVAAGPASGPIAMVT